MKIATRLMLSSAVIISSVLLVEPVMAQQPTPEPEASENQQASDEEASADPEAAAAEEAFADEEDPATVDPPSLSAEITTGVRLFLDRPPREDRAKFEQYGELPPGPFIEEFHLFADAERGPLFEGWASNVALNNQRYEMRLFDPGDYYLTLTYSELPHLYSTQARTLYTSASPSILRVADPVQSALETAPNDAARRAIIDANLQVRDIEVTRRTAGFGLRWTPGPEWDIRLDYSREERSGGMPFATAINGFNVLEFAAPISFLTQNFSASVQYVGRLGNNRRWSVSLAYNGSLFNNDLPSVTFDNPFRLSAPVGNNTANEGRASLPPDNEAHRLTLTGAIDLPFAAHYVGTFSYGVMRQNDQFLPFTINPAILSSGGTPMTNPSLLPAQSLQGEIEEMLINNLLTIRFAPHLTGTARLRHLDVQNNTPLLFFSEYVRTDSARQNDDRQNYRPAYERTTSSFDLNWRPNTAWSIGGSLSWERYDRDNREVDVTNEYTGRIFVDASPQFAPWLRLRASALHGERRFDEYDALNNVGVIGYPPIGAGFLQNPLLRKFDMADRNRTRIDASLELAFDNGLVVTPNMSWRNDEYSDNIANGGELGLKDERYWSAGIELAYPLTDSINVSLFYLREEYDRVLVNRQRGGSGTAGIACPANTTIGSPDCNWGSDIADFVDTIMGTAGIVVSSDVRLDFSGTWSHSENRTDTYGLGPANVTSVPQFPDVSNDFLRLEANLRYNLSDTLGRRLGWNGDISAEFGYAFERNHMENWATDNLAPYIIALDAGANRSLFLDALNPNYEAHIATIRLRIGWWRN